MKSASRWLDDVRSVSLDGYELAEAGDGAKTLRVQGRYIHSRYQPIAEACKLIESAGLTPERPVLVIGLGLGYHVAELIERGFEVIVAEPDGAVARLALEGPMKGQKFPLYVGDAAGLDSDPEFLEFAKRRAQPFLFQAALRGHEAWTEKVLSSFAAAAMKATPLRIAVVGPVYGGSLPISRYIERAFDRLGHKTTYIDNSMAWPIYRSIRDGFTVRATGESLSNKCTGFLNEWTYARVLEAEPNVCVVLAQAPVATDFADRLNREGIVSAYWFVENWRHMPYWSAIAPRYDCFFHIQPGEFEGRLREIGCPSSEYVPTAADPEVHRPIELTEDERAKYACDISFAGAGYRNRQRVLSGLTDFDMKIWGVEWRAPALWPHLQNGGKEFTSEDFTKIVAGSKVNVNLHSSTSHDGVDSGCDAVNPRVFEIPACGGFQVCDPCKGIETFFDPVTELPLYTSPAELRDLLRYYLERPEERREVAFRARQRVLTEHTYDHRARTMLAHIVRHCGKKLVDKGVRATKTVAEVAASEGVSPDLVEYLAGLPPDTPFSYDGLVPGGIGCTRPMGRGEKTIAFVRQVRETSEALLKLR